MTTTPDNSNNPEINTASPELKGSPEGGEVTDIAEFRAGKLAEVDQDAEGAIQRGETRLGAAREMGVPPEEVAELRRERGIDEELAEDEREIRELGERAKARMENPSGPEQAEGGSRERIIEEFSERRGELLRGIFAKIVASEFVQAQLRKKPGTVKGVEQMTQGMVKGETADGQKLTGTERIILSALGAANVIGENAALVKGAGGRLQALGEGLLKGESDSAWVKMGGAGMAGMGKIMQISAAFLEKHSDKVTKMEKVMEEGIRTRYGAQEQAA